MAVIESPSGKVAGIGEEAGSPIHTTPRVVGGHYSVTHRTVLLATQAANSRLFELRNIHASNLVVLHRVRLEWIQTAAHTAAILDSIDAFKVTGFSAVDTTSTVTPTISKLRTNMATITDGVEVAIRGVTVAGAAAGMTGGTLTKEAAHFRQSSLWLLATVPTGGSTPEKVDEYRPDPADGESPYIFANNEGFIIENRVLLGAAAGSAVSIEVNFSVVSLY